MAQAVDPLLAAREAADRPAWREAYSAYAGLDDARLEPADLERFANAAWWNGKLDQAIALRERAHTGFMSADERRSAARMALTLSEDHLARSAFAVSQGWFAKAERLLAEEQEGVEHAHLSFTRGINGLFGGGDLHEVVDELERAYDLAHRFGDRDVEALAIVAKGRAFLRMGKVEQGLSLLDEASASAVCGDLQPLATGLIYCMTISTCQDLGDYRRAAEWTEEANRWCDRLDVTGFPGACRIHRAQVMRRRGDWSQAEEQALEACAELRDFDRTITAGGYYEVGEVRRLRGDFSAAEEAFATAHELGHSAHPGLALLRLAEGKVDSAVAGVTRMLAEVDDPLMRLRLLPAQVTIAVAGADLKAARAAAEELETHVEAYKIGGSRAPAFDATVHMAWGRIHLAEGDNTAATRSLRRARDEWHGVGAPYETAAARMLLALAFRREGDEDAATTELESALSTFSRLGAKLDEERVKELLGRLEARRTFLFTDIVDSTKLLATLGEEKWKKLLARHDTLLREQIAERGGAVIKHTGDGFFAAFDNPKAAVDAAVGIQRALADEIVAPDVRIGAHSGGAFYTDADFSDYGGEGVHVAARIGAAAGPAEILFSRDTLDGVSAAYRLSEPRNATLKGFEEPVELVAVDWR